MAGIKFRVLLDSNQKEEVLDKEDEIPEFIEKKVKASSG